MQDLGADDGTRDFLKHQNLKLNTQTLRPFSSFNKKDDLIFMQIDADCDMLSHNYGKYKY